ncbi:MAG: molybdopterin-dependent oxidoreductase, partial [Candidatus Competibacterales bacterium]
MAAPAPSSAPSSAPSIAFTLDGHEVTAHPGETIWQVAKRTGTDIPHLCALPQPGYRFDGNCRACMVEVDGSRVLQASCIRCPEPGMVVKTQSERAVKARKLVFELLVADQPERRHHPDADALFWRWADRVGAEAGRFPPRRAVAPDLSHPAMAVQLDACIQCNLCVRACREVQVNDVIGMAYRNAKAKIVFDFDDPMGDSTCVACGECGQACPTGALLPASVVAPLARDPDTALPVAVGGKTSDRRVDSVCPYCGVGCQLTYHVGRDAKGTEAIRFVDGRDGPANRGRLCVKGRFGFDYIRHPQRLTTPLIRRDDAPKGVELDVDPANPYSHFRPASWEEALARAAGGLARLKDEVGPQSLAGFGSAKGSNEEAYLFQKLVRTGFGNNNVDHCTRLCHASSVAALMENIGSGAVTATFNEVAHSDVVILIGCNPTVNHPVAATFFKQAAKAGTELIIMDPRRQALSRYARHHLQFTPGSDVALLNALMHVIVEEGLYDPQYIDAHTEGFEVLRRHLADYNPAAMAPLCGIEPETLRTVARTYATAKAAIIFWGMGISQHVHGTDNARCLISLALMTGQVGRPGTGLHPLRGQNNVQGASDAGMIPMVFPDYRRVGDDQIRATFEALWQTTLDPKPGLTVVEIMEAIAAGTVKGMYIMGENPAMSDPDVRHARQALAKLEHLVVQDLFLTETACYADVVLPASAWPEKTGTVTNTNRQVQLGRQALEPPEGVRQDWELIQAMARGLGLDWNYRHPAEIFAEMSRAMPSLANITWERLEREGSG